RATDGSSQNAFERVSSLHGTLVLPSPLSPLGGTAILSLASRWRRFPTYASLDISALWRRTNRLPQCRSVSPCRKPEVSSNPAVLVLAIVTFASPASLLRARRKRAACA